MMTSDTSARSPGMRTAVSAAYRPAIALMLVAAIVGCGKSPGGKDSAPIASRADLTVKYDVKRRKCVVALPTEAQGSIIACDDVVPFIRDELKVPGGSIYDLGSIPDSDPHPAEIDKVRASLDGAGYRFIGGPHKGF